MNMIIRMLSFQASQNQNPDQAKKDQEALQVKCTELTKQSKELQGKLQENLKNKKGDDATKIQKQIDELSKCFCPTLSKEGKCEEDDITEEIFKKRKEAYDKLNKMSLLTMSLIALGILGVLAASYLGYKYFAKGSNNNSNSNSKIN